jgi:arsenite methyltransferase
VLPDRELAASLNPQAPGETPADMSKQPLFDEETSRKLEAIYLSEDAARRRRAVLDAIGPRPGESAVDIGTGPGFLAFELAEAVGATGSVLGVDLSEPMLQLARARCADKAQTRFETGDAASLPIPEASADIAVSIQVFEYVPVVEDALAEMYRILRPGGRGAIVASDWTTIAWNSSDDARMQRILAAFAPHCAHQDLPRHLRPKLLAAGFEVDRQAVLPQFNPVYDAHSFSMLLSAPIAAYVRGTERATTEEVAAWSADLRRAGERGDYFFCLNQYLFGITKPGAA